MLKPYVKLGERFGYMNYGYLWYKPFDDREVYAAIGDSGNIIYANKKKCIKSKKNMQIRDRYLHIFCYNICRYKEMNHAYI